MQGQWGSSLEVLVSNIEFRRKGTGYRGDARGRTNKGRNVFSEAQGRRAAKAQMDQAAEKDQVHGFFALAANGQRHARPPSTAQLAEMQARNS